MESIPQLKPLMEEYLASLSEKEKKAYEIAQEQLGMSFDLKKSNGFIVFLQKKNV